MIKIITENESNLVSGGTDCGCYNFDDVKVRGERADSMKECWEKCCVEDYEPDYAYAKFGNYIKMCDDER